MAALSEILGPDAAVQVEALARLLLAGLLGALVGYEREAHHRGAGLRTYILVSVGACLFTLVSLYGFPDSDPARVAAQIVTGIGFIGAGTIIRAQGSVHGLTTAATIFVLASVGMAVGSGFYWTGVFAAVMMVLALSLLGWMERHFEWKTEVRSYELLLPESELLVTTVMPELERRDLHPHNFSARPLDGKVKLCFDLDASVDQHRDLLKKFTTWNLACEMVQPLGGRMD